MVGVAVILNRSNSPPSTGSGAVPILPSLPSGKGRSDENFPVASWLLAKNIRPHVIAFYDFARAADDIADSSSIPPDDKLSRLDSTARTLAGADDASDHYDTAIRLRESLEKWGGTPSHALDLIAAFKQDAKKNRYSDWHELMSYCELSANPVGRFLLDIHGEDSAGYPASDALCTALQILNHLQDFGDDYTTLDRIYIPADLIQDAGLDFTCLAKAAVGQSLRSVLDRLLDQVDSLVEHSQTLPGQLKNRRLAMESSIIVRLAARLARRLRQGDPLAERVALSKGDFLAAATAGITVELFRKRKSGDPNK